MLAAFYNLADWSAGDVVAASALLFAAGFALRRVGVHVARKEQQKVGVLAAATEQIRADIVRFQAENSYLPAVPVNLGTDYEGWFEEALKRIQLRSVHRTREEQLKLARQADELGRIYHSIVQTQQNIEETVLAGSKRHGELRDDIDLQPLEKKKRQRQLQYDIAELETKLRAIKSPSPPAGSREPADPIQREVDRIASRIRTEHGLMEASDKMAGENPNQADQIKRAFRKRIERLREEE
jgi:hypothetical protein